MADEPAAVRTNDSHADRFVLLLGVFAGVIRHWMCALVPIGWSPYVPLTFFTQFATASRKSDADN